jgi:hypothetical protein
MMDHGSYSASLEESTGNPPAITFLNLGNSYRFVRVVRWDDPQGYVDVSVVDQSGQRVPGVVLVFTFANGIEGGGTTPDSGEFATGGVVSQCSISITPPAGYALPLPNQTRYRRCGRGHVDPRTRDLYEDLTLSLGHTGQHLVCPDAR